MIIGECPYCDAMVTTPIAEKTPCLSKEKCEECGAYYWLKHSRLEPIAYPLESVIEDGVSNTIKIGDQVFKKGDH